MSPQPQTNLTQANITCSGQLEVRDPITIINLIALLFLMISLGMAITWDQLKDQLRAPKTIIVSQIGQYIVMPALGYGLTVGFALEPAFAIGAIAIATSPGGALSNMFAVLFQSDVPLSIAATSVSSIAAIGMMPLNQYIYMVATGVANNFCFQPTAILLAAGVVVLGALFGIWWKIYLDKREMYKTVKAFFIIGTLSALVIAILGFYLSGTGTVPFYAAPSNLVGVIILLCTIGTTFGMVCGFALGLTPPERVTLALEVGIQNLSIPISIIGILFPSPTAAEEAAGIVSPRDEALAGPLLFGFVSLIGGFIFGAFMWKLGQTNLPREKGFIEAFKIAIAEEKALVTHEGNDRGKTAPEDEAEDGKA